MRYKILSVSIITLLAAQATISACANSPAVEMSKAQQSMTTPSKKQQTRVPGEYIVTLGTGEDESAISDQYARLGIKNIKALGNSTFLLIITDDIGPEDMRTIGSQDSRIKAVQPNYIYKANEPVRNTE